MAAAANKIIKAAVGSGTAPPPPTPLSLTVFPKFARQNS
jgi:hypothetical protein